MLTKDELESYKKVLLEAREELMTKVQTEDHADDFGRDVSDREDEEADQTEEYAIKLATIQSMKDRVNRIDEALSKMDGGEYGTCSKCGSEISKEVLDLVPESILCSNCKQ